MSTARPPYFVPGKQALGDRSLYVTGDGCGGTSGKAMAQQPEQWGSGKAVALRGSSAASGQ